MMVRWPTTVRRQPNSMTIWPGLLKVNGTAVPVAGGNWMHFDMARTHKVGSTW